MKAPSSETVTVPCAAGISTKAVSGPRADGACDFPAAQLGQVDIENDRVRLEVGHRAHHMAPGVHAAHLVAFLAQQHHQGEDRVAIVLGDEDPQRPDCAGEPVMVGKRRGA